MQQTSLWVLERGEPAAKPLFTFEEGDSEPHIVHTTVREYIDPLQLSFSAEELQKAIAEEAQRIHTLFVPVMELWQKPVEQLDEWIRQLQQERLHFATQEAYRILDKTMHKKLEGERKPSAAVYDPERGVFIPLQEKRGLKTVKEYYNHEAGHGLDHMLDLMRFAERDDFSCEAIAILVEEALGKTGKYSKGSVHTRAQDALRRLERTTHFEHMPFANKFCMLQTVKEEGELDERVARYLAYTWTDGRNPRLMRLYDAQKSALAGGPVNRGVVQVPPNGFADSHRLESYRGRCSTADWEAFFGKLRKVLPGNGSTDPENNGWMVLEHMLRGSLSVHAAHTDNEHANEYYIATTDVDGVHAEGLFWFDPRGKLGCDTFHARSADRIKGWPRLRDTPLNEHITRVYTE